MGKDQKSHHGKKCCLLFLVHELQIHFHSPKSSSSGLLQQSSVCALLSAALKDQVC